MIDSSLTLRQRVVLERKDTFLHKHICEIIFIKGVEVDDLLAYHKIVIDIIESIADLSIISKGKSLNSFIPSKLIEITKKPKGSERATCKYGWIGADVIDGVVVNNDEWAINLTKWRDTALS